MILTGKCLDEFLKWIHKEYDYTFNEFQALYPTQLKNTLILDYFDSVKILISINHLITPLSHNIYFTTKVGKYSSDLSNSRQDALIDTFKKANEIRNEQLK